MANDNSQQTIMAGVAVGILAGALIGIVFAKRAHRHTTEEISETVEELKVRAQHVLTELTANVSDLIDKSRELFPDHKAPEISAAESRPA